MSKTIQFDVVSWNGQKLDLIVETGEDTERLVLAANRPFSLDEDSLAIALSTLAGQEFGMIRFGLDLSDRVRTGIAEWTKTEVDCGRSSEEREVPVTTEKSVLNFSGGFDSLAAKSLLGGSPALVSLDFGGRFSRERNFFEKFDPWIIQTNLTETSLRRNSWSFMGIGPLLLRGEISSKYFAFGSVLEAGGLRLEAPTARNFTFPPFKLAGYENAAPVAGVSEIGTALILLDKSPELAVDSLISLASPGEEKLYRKYALLKTVSEITDSKVSLPAIPPVSRVHYVFGQNLAVDLTAIFFTAIGLKEYSDWIVKEIPAGITGSISEHDVEFMFKADQNYYSHYPEPLRPMLEEGLSSAGIAWYGEEDYESVRKVKRLLGPYYRF